MHNIIQQILQDKKLDGVIITSQINRRYVSGFTGTDGIILITQDEPYLFVDGRYTLQAQQETNFRVVEYKSNPFELINEFGLENIGFEEEDVTYSQYKSIKNTIIGANLHPFSKVFTELRMIKTDEEISKIRRAASIADMAFTHILSFAKQGVSEVMIALELENCMRRNGAEGVSFNTIAISGKRTALPHGEPTRDQLKNGDFLLMDYGCKFEGYCSDMTRTVAIGEVTDRQIAIYNSVLKAQKIGLENIKSGIMCKDVDNAVRNSLSNDSFEQYFNHSTGHGVGLFIHEEPRISNKSQQTLRANMVVTVEPGVYISDFCGVRIEDIVVVTDNGPDILSKSSKELLII